MISQNDCGCECTPQTEAGAQGSQGIQGEQGTASFTITTAAFTQPAIGGTVSVSVVSTDWIPLNSIVFVETGGYYNVSVISDSTTVVLQNRGVTGYAAPAASVPLGSKVVMSALVEDNSGCIVVASSPYTHLVTDNGKTLLVNAVAGNRTINLPSAVTAGCGHTFNIIKTDSSANYVQVEPDGTETVGGRDNGRLFNQFDEVTLFSDGTNWQILSAKYQKRRVVFTASGTWTTLDETPLGCQAIDVTCAGGGGGGGGGDTGTNWRGVGGGAGGGSKETIPVSSLSATETVTVGVAGIPGASSGTPTAGNPGGTSSFGALITGNPGLGGTAATGSALNGVAGGTGGGGDVNIQGGGSTPMVDGPSVDDVSTGGDAPFGLGYGGKNVAANGTGYASGGACADDSGGSAGAGVPGIIFVDIL